MTLFHLWNLPGDVLAAPESAQGWIGVISLSLSLSHPYTYPSAPEDTAKLAEPTAVGSRRPPRYRGNEGTHDVDHGPQGGAGGDR